jgi:hypothetical protein
MQPKSNVVRPARAVQTSLFHQPNQPSPTWDRVPAVAKDRVVDALAQVLLRASGSVIGEHEEAGDDD